MAVYVWQQDMDPDFPLAVIEYTALGDGDPMHWHDHFEVALVLDGAGEFMFGKRALRAEPGDIFFTGTPHGVVFGKPKAEQVWLKPGDRVVCSVEKLGELAFSLA